MTLSPGVKRLTDHRPGLIMAINGWALCHERGHDGDITEAQRAQNEQAIATKKGPIVSRYGWEGMAFLFITEPGKPTAVRLEKEE